jgi:nucleoside 2-deoxyribosyltransferase
MEAAMIYLAAPYSHPDPAVREQRFRAACAATAKLLRAGQVAFAPIVHSHPLVAYGLPTGWDFWERCDREHLRRCDEVLVLMLEGWQESVGVQAEIRIATELGKAVRFLEPGSVKFEPALESSKTRE